jgi:predicted nucleotidyltransferase
MAEARLSVEEIKERLAPLFEDKELQLALLFGSTVSGKFKKKRSDVDVADLRYANPLLRFSVAKNGKLLFERSPGLFHEFVSLAFRRYVDTKKLRDAQTKAIEHFLEERGLA